MSEQTEPEAEKTAEGKTTDAIAKEYQVKIKNEYTNWGCAGCAVVVFLPLIVMGMMHLSGEGAFFAVSVALVPAYVLIYIVFRKQFIAKTARQLCARYRLRPPELFDTIVEGRGYNNRNSFGTSQGS